MVVSHGLWMKFKKYELRLGQGLWNLGKRGNSIRSHARLSPVVKSRVEDCTLRFQHRAPVPRMTLSSVHSGTVADFLPSHIQHRIPSRHTLCQFYFVVVTLTLSLSPHETQA